MSTGQEMVLEALRKATSQDLDVLKPAEQQLTQWEDKPWFYSTLMKIFSELSLEVDVRWLAVVYFKNGIDRYWRKNAPNALSEEEKREIRGGLLLNLKEPITQIANQLAVLIGKISRLDLPKDWPELIPSLFEYLKTGDDLVKHRTLLTMHHVIKQLASKRLAGDRRLFQDLTNQIFGCILELWQNQTDTCLQAAGCNSPLMVASLERAHLSLKILRKLVIHGFKRPHENSDVVNFMKAIFERMKDMLSFRLQNKGIDVVCSITEKYVILLTKILHDFLENFPFSFLQFIKPSLEISCFYAFTKSGDEILFERFIVQCLNLIQAILMCHEYKPCKVVEDTKNPETLEAFQIKRFFFQDNVLRDICQKLITHYFLLTTDDLLFWDSNPEGFCMEIEGGESWKYSLRPCVEHLFVTLFHEFRVPLTPLIISMVQASYKPVDPNDYQRILEKDAIYNAVGLAAFELFDDIDFDEWFTTYLINELKIKDSNYRIIRRRVIWLIGQWTCVKFSPSNRPILYEVCIHLLAPEEDFVVRLSAAMTIRTSIDDFEFNTDQFLTYLPTSFSLLFRLLKDASECDTKMQVLHVMSFLVEAIGVGIQPYAGPLVQYLPELWDESADHCMLRCAILTTLIHIVTGLMVESENLQGFLIKVIGISTDVSEPSHIYLLEDGLQLWFTILENTARPNKQLLDLYHNLIPTLEYSSESLKTSLLITTAYILLCPQEFLSRYGQILVQNFQVMLKELRNEGVILVLKCLETIMRVSPDNIPVLTHSLLPDLFSQLASNEVSYPMVLSMYLSIVARVLLYSEEAFMQVINKASVMLQKSSEEALYAVMSVWVEKLALVTPDERRKLCALGLAQLCGSGWPPAMKLWSLAITAVTEVVFDVSLDDTNEDKLVVGVVQSESPDTYEAQTEHYQRRLALAQKDPVHTMPLRKFLGQQLHRLQAVANPAVISGLVQDLEDDCKKLLQEVILAG